MLNRYCLITLLIAAPLTANALDLGGLLDKLPQKQNAARGSSSHSSGSGLGQISNSDQISGLKQALTQGAETAVKSLAQKGGYLDNVKVRIPLPDKLQKVQNMMQKIGMGKYADDLVTSMNRAAEAAAPEAKDLLVDAAKKMTVTDAKNILTGPDDAATQYFRKSTETALTGKFKPIVSNAMKKVKLAETYDNFAGKGAQFGLIDQRDANLEDYITGKALDGLFLMMAEQEKAIRDNPLKAVGSLAQKVFSALK